ncbi:fumarylacetoacetase [Coniosporium apollinis CBS 100218]|uniref:Fumarylacetoacetase n=1 Tax=Coniosporium apollinis (strain CBS 100218) TaxID=1168221 RepID=R7YHM5_CONA1|nr:fumarylacetoacetase [Coniosporium apollinis CBS 100218]EON61412.1 fumarylacetoacetase [Coniosporium apollinis CBS 100218]
MTSLRSWFPIPKGSHFSLHNIPFGIISTSSSPTPHCAVAIGAHALDLEAFAANNGFSGLSTIQPHQSVFSSSSLNAFAALGRPIHSVVRKYIQSVFSVDTPYASVLKDNDSLQKEALIPLKDVTTHLPMRIGDYTDFYAGLNHAFNVGVLFRGAANALQPNYKHLPVGYHGRASSVVVSGTPIRRPSGQILEKPGAQAPIFSACRKLDIELELGCFVCKSNKMGEPIPIGEAENSLFGVVLMNDWSARDIQAWEYVPLGPFNAKNFGTTISAWVVLAEALEPYLARSAVENDVELLPYLREKREENVYDIKLQVDLKTKSDNKTTISRTTARNLLFSFPQMLAHHSITGCPMQVGDLLGSGTISGVEPSERGSLLEQNENGKATIKLEGGEERKFLEDGDEITITGVCGEDEEALVGFGECVGAIEPALQFDF